MRDFDPLLWIKKIQRINIFGKEPTGYVAFIAVSAVFRASSRKNALSQVEVYKNRIKWLDQSVIYAPKGYLYLIRHLAGTKGTLPPRTQNFLDQYKVILGEPPMRDYMAYFTLCLHINAVSRGDALRKARRSASYLKAPRVLTSNVVSLRRLKPVKGTSR